MRFEERETKEMMMRRGIVEDTRLEEGYLWRKNQKLYLAFKIKKNKVEFTHESHLKINDKKKKQTFFIFIFVFF